MPHIHLLRTSVLVGALAVGACSDTSDPLGPPPAASVSPGAEIMFNPQPDPPHTLLRFAIDTPELLDPDTRSWSAVLFDGQREPAGIVQISLLSAVQHGGVLQLRQSWNFATLAAVGTAELKGTLNLASGRLVLRGFGADGGLIHVEGRLLRSEAGSSIGGDVMFNPQPDPPLTAGAARAAGPALPALQDAVARLLPHLPGSQSTEALRASLLRLEADHLTDDPVSTRTSGEQADALLERLRGMLPSQYGPDLDALGLALHAIRAAGTDQAAQRIQQ